MFWASVEIRRAQFRGELGVTAAVLRSGLIVLMVVFMSNSVSASEIVVVGASITQQWHVEELSRRAPDVSHQVSSLLRYEFDKSPEINSILSRQKKPAVVIIKACAAYFPGDL